MYASWNASRNRYFCATLVAPGIQELRKRSNETFFRESREQAAHERGFGNASDGQRHCRSPWWYVVLAHHLQHFLERALHDFLEADIDFVGIPEQAFLVLHHSK